MLKLLSKIAIIFDLDGTLVDSLPDICGHINRVREDYGLQPSPIHELVPFIGQGVQHLAECALPEVGAEEVPVIVEKFRNYYADSPHLAGRPYPGVFETLKQLDADPRVRLAIATNKLSGISELVVAHYLPGISFDCIAGPDKVSARKPDPAHLLEVIAKLGCQPENAWYVGDHPVDLECSQAARVNFLGATYGFGGVQVEPERQLASFDQLLKKIGLA